MTRGPGAKLEEKFFDPVQRIAERVLAGNIVFFVGAGFSIDAEGNSANRLIGRLLVRLVAMSSVTQRYAGEQSRGGAVMDRLRTAFRLKNVSRIEPARCITRDNVDALAREYYTFNEWVMTALGTLADEVLKLDLERLAQADRDMCDMERLLIPLLGDSPAALEPVNWCAIGQLESSWIVRGKALFLDTMGFANPRVMAGSPRDSDSGAVLASYGDRLGARHHALARLAREGLAPLLVTTNYDLLIEGAYRLAGLTDREHPPKPPPSTPQASVSTYSRVAGARFYFGSGDTERTARIFKIHGCADHYRMARGEVEHDAGADPKAWAAYLPALVFSYREIQTWRRDAWSRDLIRTLLRTQSLVLCGYSGADPVLHSTFREVYEEMSALAVDHVGDTRDRRRTAIDTPLFFFDVADKREFHGFELLRAATSAAGLKDDDSLLEHPNHVEFEVARDHFPRLDDHFRLLSHLVMRESQSRAINARLRRLALRLLKRPCTDAEHDTLTRSFESLRAAEKSSMLQAATDVTDVGAASAATRRAFDDAVGWTWHFLPGLMRELAIAELVESRTEPGFSPDGVRDAPWYYPVAERPEWAAWAAVLELAIRNMVHRLHAGVPALPGRISAEESAHAVLSFTDGSEGVQPVALCIRLKGFERIGRPLRLVGAFRRTVLWEFSEQDVPWETLPTPELPLEPKDGEMLPSAGILWRFALGDTGWGVSEVAQARALEWSKHCLGVPA